MGCASSQTASETCIVVGIFGIDGSGKTCFLHSLVGDFDFGSIVPTIGLGQKTISCRKRSATLYDLGGSTRVRSVWPRFYPELWGFIFVIDAADSARFAEAAEVLESVKAHPMMADKPFVIVANKQDCEGALTAQALRTACEIPDTVKVFETVATCARRHQEVEGVVARLVDEIKQQEAELANKTTGDMKKQNKNEEQERAEKRARLEQQRRAEVEQ
jgi:small GTP-binding protein